MTTGTTPDRLSIGTARSWRIARWALVANLVGQVGIVLTGGLVRVTGSGLGCPTWPQCTPGSFTPVMHQAEGYHKYIEFGNRTLTFVLTAVAIAVLVTVRRADRSRTAVAAWPLILVLAQAVLGGVVVLLGLAPISVVAHLLLSMVSIAVSTWLWLTLPPGARPQSPTPHSPGPVPPAAVRTLVTAAAAAAAVVLVLGTVVTGTGPHSGDADTPQRFDFDPVLVSRLHAGAVWLFVACLVAVIVLLRRAGATGRLYRWSHVAFGIAVVQGAVGYIQYATGVPWPLVALHMLLAASLVVPVTGMAFEVRRSPATL
jgi:cytochrome c oxidase assembly protein subunit 15